MTLKPAILLMAPLLAAAAQPLPQLRTEAVTGGSVFHVKNAAAQPLTVVLIELLGYPGSSYWLAQDVAIPPGVEALIPVGNMIVGAAPDYVKVTAALYADGSSAGDPAKVAMLEARRKTIADTAKEAVRRIEEARQAGKDKAAIAAGLKEWAESIELPAKANRLSPEAVNRTAARSTASKAAAYLSGHSIEETIAHLGLAR